MKNKFSKALAAALVAVGVSPTLALAQANKVSITQQNIDLPKGFFLDPGNLLNTVLRIVLIIGVLLVFFFLIQGGLEWITSAGDKGNVEKARNKITNAIIGLVILVASYAILTLVLNFLGIGSFNDVLKGNI